MKLRRSALAFLISLSLLSLACPKKTDLVGWGEEVVNSASEVIPILAAAGKDTRKAEQFRDYARKLVNAIKANDGTALGYAASCIDLLEELAADSKLITDPARRTTVLVVLAVANIALHRLADRLPAGAQPESAAAGAEARAVTTIEAFKARKKWRCRNSTTGRFEKMEVCRANPATTQVETY